VPAPAPPSPLASQPRPQHSILRALPAAQLEEPCMPLSATDAGRAALPDGAGRLWYGVAYAPPYESSRIEEAMLVLARPDGRLARVPFAAGVALPRRDGIVSPCVGWMPGDGGDGGTLLVFGGANSDQSRFCSALLALRVALPSTDGACGAVTAATEVPITQPAAPSRAARSSKKAASASASASAASSSAPPCARYLAASAVHAGVFYVLGGAVRAPPRDVAHGVLVLALWDLHAFTPTSAAEPWRGGAWRATPLSGAAPPARARSAAGLYSCAQVQRGRELWLFCGHTNSGYSSETYVVDLPTGAVRCLAPPLHGATPRARIGASACACPLPDGADGFLLAGGATERVNMCDAWTFHPATHAWAPLTLRAPPACADPRRRLRDAPSMARELLGQSLLTFPAPAAAATGALLLWGGGVYASAQGCDGVQTCTSFSDLVVLCSSEEGERDAAAA
jgi:hypothetical protein